MARLNKSLRQISQISAIYVQVKLNYCKQVFFFTHNILPWEFFLNKKVGNRKNQEHLKLLQNKKGLNDVTAAPFSESFSQLPAAKTHTKNGTAVTSLRSFLFRDCFSIQLLKKLIKLKRLVNNNFSNIPSLLCILP